MNIKDISQKNEKIEKEKESSSDEQPDTSSATTTSGKKASVTVTVQNSKMIMDVPY